MGLITSALFALSGWIVGLIAGVFSMIFLLMTRGVTWPVFKSKITGKPLVLLQRKDERYGFITGDYKGGYVDLGRWGKFVATRNSFKPFAGTTLAQAREGFAAIPTPEYINAAKNLKELGYENIEQVEADIPNLESEREDPKTSKKRKQVIESIFSSLAVIDDFNKTAASIPVLDEVIDQEVKMKMNRRQNDSMVKIIALAILAAAILGGIAMIIHFRQCPNCNALCGAAMNMARNTTVVNM